MTKKRHMSSVEETFYFIGICFITAKKLNYYGERLLIDKRMLIENLYYTLSNEEQYLESRQGCVSPDVSARKANTVIVLDKFRKDIEALEEYTGRKLYSGLCIMVGLSELLTVIPMERKRTYAYNTLVQYLKDKFWIDLVIDSKKRKWNGFEK